MRPKSALLKVVLGALKVTRFGAFDAEARISRLPAERTSRSEHYSTATTGAVGPVVGLKTPPIRTWIGNASPFR